MPAVLVRLPSAVDSAVELLADEVGALQRQRVVDLLRAGLAGVADDVHADLGGGAFLGDLPQPHAVGAAHPRVGPEVGAARIEQELHAELVVGDAEGDDPAERLLGLGRAAELDGGEVDAVHDPDLLAGGHRQRAPVLAERLDVALLVVERGRLVDHGRGGDALEIEGVAALPRRRRRGAGVAFDHLVLHQHRAVAVVGERRVVEAFVPGQRRRLGDDRAGLQIGEREVDLQRALAARAVAFDPASSCRSAGTGRAPGSPTGTAGARTGRSWS